MMKNRELLKEAVGDEEVMIFENYDYDRALIGYSDDYRAIYDYDLMVEYLIDKEEWGYEEAIEWIEYNTIRALGYYGSKAPIIMYRI